eukprot:50358-Eustigmatos_ZCMA.PRE.1
MAISMSDVSTDHVCRETPSIVNPPANMSEHQLMALRKPRRGRRIRGNTAVNRNTTHNAPLLCANPQFIVY